MKLKAPPHVDELLTVNAVARASARSRHSILRWILEGKVTAIPVIDGRGRRQFLVARSEANRLATRPAEQGAAR